MVTCSTATQPNNEFTDERSTLLSTPKSQEISSSHKNSPAAKNSAKSTSKWSTIIEPVLFLNLVARSLSDTVITNLLENRTCLVELKLSDRNCTEPISAAIEDLVQPTTAKIITARSLIEASIPSFFILLIGPWSDSNGRKPFLVLALVGQTIAYLTWGCISLMPGIQPPAFLLASLPISLTGGGSAILLLMYCYITDVTDDKNRPFRLSLMTLAIFTSSIVGLALAPMFVEVQNSLNPYPLIFFTTATLLALTTVYTLFVISESVDVRPDRKRRLFQFSQISNLCRACFSKREGNARFMILTIISTLAITVFMSEGEGAILYLSAREMFQWSLSDYTKYQCFICLFGPGTVVGVWLLTRMFGLSNMQGATLALATRLVRAPIMATATAGWQFYLASVVSSLAFSYVPLVRSELGRLAPHDDLGKIFALTAFLEAFSPVGAAPLYTTVYTATYLTAPGTVYWLSAFFTMIAFLLLVSVTIKQRVVKGACYIQNSEGTSSYTKITE